MSQQNYAEYGFGLILCGEEINNFSQSLATNPYEIPWIAEFEGFARYYAEDAEGKRAYYINNNYLEDEDMLVFWAERQPNAFKAVYSKEEIVNEFKKKIGKYLPNNFDYISHIGYFQCCLYC